MRRIMVLACALLPALTATAHAATVVPGGTITDQVWTPAGSPYRLEGDVTVAAGSTLTIAAGTVVELAAGDSQAAGLDPARIELTVNGRLRIEGTGQDQVRFHAASGTVPGSWYGIVVGATASEATVTGAVVEHATFGLRGDGADAGLQVATSTFRLAAKDGIRLSAGAATLTGISVESCNEAGLRVTGSAQASINGAVIRDNLVAGIAIGQLPGKTTTVTRATLFANAANAILLADGAVTSSTVIKSSIIAASANAINRTDASGCSVSFTDFFGNTNTAATFVDTPGSFSANPLFVSAADLHPTANSPARLAGDAGQDLGGLPYAGQPTPGLHGVLHEDTTITAEGGPYLVAGDLTVAAGAVLTLDPGAVLQFATTDIMKSGADIDRPELNIVGKLHAVGSEAAPIRLRGANTTQGGWFGVRLLGDAGGSVLSHVVVSGAIHGLSFETSATSTVERSTFEQSSASGIRVLAGAHTFDQVISRDNGVPSSFTYGVFIEGDAQATFVHSIIANNSGDGVAVYRASFDRTTTLLYSTVHGNGRSAVATHSGFFTSTVIVRNSILAFNNDDYESSGGGDGSDNTTLSVDHTLYDGFDFLAGPGNLQSRPLLVSATDLHPTTNSPARFASDVGDAVGALPYVGDPSPALCGTLWSDLTLTASGSPYVVPGDLTVSPGVTLTVEPGVTLQFAQNDLMRAADYSTIELRVRGTLRAEGTVELPITFTGTTTHPNPYYWGGVEILPGAVVSLRRVSVDSSSRGFEQLASVGSSATHTSIVSSTFHDNGVGLSIVGGNVLLDGVLAHSNPNGGIDVFGDAWSLVNPVARANGLFGIRAGVSAQGVATIASATAHANEGPGIQIMGSAGGVVLVRNAIVSNNQASVTQQGATAVFTGSDVWMNQHDVVACTTGCLAVDPQYLSVTDLRLRAGSPCIDAGSAQSAPDHDALGVPRPFDGNSDGTAELDLGAYEFASNCGNGLLEVGETCDDGLANGQYNHCLANCSGPGAFCGDSIVNGPEECDDASPGGACTPECRTARCGDGYVRVGVEACDDGNTDETDGCRNSCQLARCGDGVVFAGHEACDDGNTLDTDACLSFCRMARCGDGYVQAGVEDCDDGNSLESDGCVACVAARCGDGFLRPGLEACDDGNQQGGDGCSATCEDEGPAPPDAGPPGPPGEQPSDSGGCGCTVAHGAHDPGAAGSALGLLAVAALLAARRRGRDRV